MAVRSREVAPTGVDDQRRRAVVAAIEGSEINIYSFSLDGADQRLLATHDIGYLNLGPNHHPWPVSLVSATISKSGNLIVYKVPGPAAQVSPIGPGSIFVMDPNGENKRKILDQISFYYPSPDGSKVLYAEVPPPAVSVPGGGRPARSPSRNWRILDIVTGEDRPVITDEALGHGFTVFQSWIDEEKAVFASFFYDDAELFFVGLNNRSAKEIHVPTATRYFGATDETSVSASGVGSVLLASHDRSRLGGWPGSCDIFELNSDGTLGELYVTDQLFTCQNVHWNNDDELFYTKETRPVPMSLTSEENYLPVPIRDSVFSFDLETKTTHRVLLSNGTSDYTMVSLLPNHALYVVNGDIHRSPRIIHEIRDLDGGNPITLLSGDWFERPVFVGWSI